MSGTNCDFMLATEDGPCVYAYMLEERIATFLRVGKGEKNEKQQ